MKEILSFDGQEVVWKPEEGILFTHIEEPFYSAGTQYGWEGNKMGIGINEKIIDFGVKEYATLIIVVKNHPEVYYCDAIDWKLFCKKHNSIFLKRMEDRTIRLMIMQMSQLMNHKENKMVEEKQSKLPNSLYG